MEDISKIFHIEWKILLAQTVNFLLVVFLLWRYAFGPISKVLNDRSKKIEEGLRNAEESKKNLLEVEERSKEIIKEARAESQKIIKDSYDAAEKLREVEIKKAKEESLKIMESGKKALFLEKENILNQIKKESAELVVLAVEKIAKKEV